MKRHDTKVITTAWDRVRELGTVTYRQFDWWVRAGLITVQAPFGTGSGFPRTITDDELNVVAWMGHLTALGVEPGRAVILGRQLTEQGWADLGGLTITWKAVA